MAAAVLTTASVLMCPHGGTVTATSANLKAKAQGASILCATDTFVIAGCPLNISGAPHPCLQVQWISTALQSTAGSNPTLTMQSSGLCVAGDGAPQGSVIIASTQPAVGGQ